MSKKMIVIVIILVAIALVGTYMAGGVSGFFQGMKFTSTAVDTPAEMSGDMKMDHSMDSMKDGKMDHSMNSMKDGKMDHSMDSMKDTKMDTKATTTTTK